MIVKVFSGPTQPFSFGVTCTVATTGSVPRFTAVKAPMSPPPDVPKPTSDTTRPVECDSCYWAAEVDPCKRCVVAIRTLFRNIIDNWQRRLIDLNRISRVFLNAAIGVTDLDWIGARNETPKQTGGLVSRTSIFGVLKRARPAGRRHGNGSVGLAETFHVRFLNENRHGRLRFGDGGTVRFSRIHWRLLQRSDSPLPVNR